MTRNHKNHRIRDTSLDAYSDIMPELGPRQLLVLKVIMDYGKTRMHPTDREIARALGHADPNKVRPRRFELMQYGLITEAGKRKCSVSGKTALTWKLTRKKARFIS